MNKRIENIYKAASIFRKFAQAALDKDPSLLIENKLYETYGKPPMKMINAVTDDAYVEGTSVNLLVSNYDSNTDQMVQPYVKFTSSDNQTAANELQDLFGQEIIGLLTQLKTQHKDVPRWEFYADKFVQFG
jgi:hypothetical protein